MSLTSTPAYIAIVGEDHTIILPEEIPVGAQVTITVILPTAPNELDETRRARFEETLAAIHAASVVETPAPAISDQELDTLIKKARKAPRGE